MTILEKKNAIVQFIMDTAGNEKNSFVDINDGVLFFRLSIQYDTIIVPMRTDSDKNISVKTTKTYIAIHEQSTPIQEGDVLVWYYLPAETNSRENIRLLNNVYLTMRSYSTALALFKF